MIPSKKEIAKLMTAVPRKDGRENRDGKPRWSAEQFMVSLNFAIKLAATRKGINIDPITFEQAERFLADGWEVFDNHQHEVFERWVEQRLGFCDQGQTFAPPAIMQTMNCDPTPVLLPMEAQYVDDREGRFPDVTNHRARGELVRNASPVLTGRPA